MDFPISFTIPPASRFVFVEQRNYQWLCVYIYMQNVRPKLYQVKAKAWFRVGFQITWRIIGDNFSICWISVRTGCRYWRGVLMWENVNDYWIWDLINFRNIWFLFFFILGIYDWFYYVLNLFNVLIYKLDATFFISEIIFTIISIINLSYI